MPSESVPWLSLVMTAHSEMTSRELRDFVGALRFNHQQLAARDVPHEIVLVELASRRGGRPLANLVLGAVEAFKGRAFTSFVIDPGYGAAIGDTAASQSLRMVANNVGIRRARGAFVLSIGPGTCLGRRLLIKFAERTIDRGVVYRALRVDVAIDTWDDVRGCESFEHPLGVVGRIHTPRGRMYPPDAADVFLLDAATFRELRGFDENRSAQRLGAGSLVTKAHVNRIAVCSLGAPVYRVHHGPPNELAQGTEEPGIEKYVGYLNPDTWGLGTARPREIGPQCVWLEYESSAVPPLVDLNRLVPVSRSAEVRGRARGSSS